MRCTLCGVSPKMAHDRYFGLGERANQLDARPLDLDSLCAGFLYKADCVGEASLTAPW